MLEVLRHLLDHPADTREGARGVLDRAGLRERKDMGHNSYQVM